MIASTLIAAPAPMFFLVSFWKTSWFFSIDVLNNQHPKERESASFVRVGNGRSDAWSNSHPSDVDDGLGGGRRFGRVVDLGLDDTERSSDSKSSVEDIDSDDDGISTSEGLDDLESTGPVSVSGGENLLRVLNLLVVRCEFVEEMVDDVGCGSRRAREAISERFEANERGIETRRRKNERLTFEQPHSQLVRQLLSLLIHRHIEAKHTSQLLRLLQHRRSLNHIPLVNRSDVDRRNRNLAGLEEIQESLERSKRRSLNGHSSSGLVDPTEQVLKIRHDFLSEILLVVLGSNDEQSRSSDGLLEIGSGDLDSESGLDFLVVDVGGLRKEGGREVRVENEREQEGERNAHLDSHLPQRLRRQQRSHVGENRTVQPTHHDPISLPQVPIRKDNIDGRSQSLDDLDLEHGALEFRNVHQALGHSLLSKIDEELDHIGDSLSSDGGGRDEGDVSTEVLVLVVEGGVETLFGEGDLGLLDSGGELSLDGGGLTGEGLLEGSVGSGVPAVDSIDLREREREKVSETNWRDGTRPRKTKTNLVQSDDERSLLVSKELERLESLRLETVL